jgi:hypothetical protein
MAITENMIEVRAIELIQQMQLTQPGLNLVKNKRMLEHEFGHLILGYPPSVFGEAYIGAQWQAALSFVEGDGAEYTRIRQLFIDSSVRDRKTSQQIYSYDLHQNNDDGVNDQQMTNVKIHTVEQPEYHDFIKLFDKTDEVSVIRQKQAASIFFDTTMKEKFPVAKKLIEIHDGKRPSYDDITNVRVIIHLDKNKGLA